MYGNDHLERRSRDVLTIALSHHDTTAFVRQELNCAEAEHCPFDLVAGVRSRAFAVTRAGEGAAHRPGYVHSFIGEAVHG